MPGHGPGRAGIDGLHRRVAPWRCAGSSSQRGIKLPTLGKLITEGGVYATGVRNVLPTVTYPDHTTLITGVWPSRHGIAGNQTFDPLQQNMTGWYWYAEGHQGEDPVGRGA